MRVRSSEIHKGKLKIVKIKSEITQSIGGFQVAKSVFYKLIQMASMAYEIRFIWLGGLRSDVYDMLTH